jgi:hypothetical protein
MTILGLALVEGATEEKLVRELLVPQLQDSGVFVAATTRDRKRTQGGVQA